MARYLRLSGLRGMPGEGGADGVVSVKIPAPLLKRSRQNNAFGGQTLELQRKVYDTIASLLENKSIQVTDDMPLIGDDSLLDSMRLVELCLGLEDIAAANGFDFDWTSAAAMSRSRGMFRTAGALADEFSRQSQNAR